MTELLAPAGNYDAFIAAVSNGCDAVYLALEKFGARAYADNFNVDKLIELVDYAHLRNVKIYVTMNTIIFENELNEAYEQIDAIYASGADGIIIQDLALIDYVAKKYPLMEAHASTQMGLEDIEGVDFVDGIGVKRAVLGRETPIERIKEIKKLRLMPIEIFVHGALCVSYSGNCLMSGLIGYRSGNRGRCVGSCRKPYKLIDTTNNITISESYILSMKDLNTTAYIKDLIGIDSLKIEGRMKEPSYVANIIRSYRDLLDGKNNITEVEKNLTKTFNRTFTKGYILGEDKKDISNTIRPNHNGYKIGYISRVQGRKYQITLTDTLNQGDQIRIANKDEEVNMPVIKLLNKDGDFINSSSTICYIELKEHLEVDDIVYKTKDVKFIQELDSTYPKEFKRFPISFFVNGKIGEPLSLTISYEDIYETVTSEYLIQESEKNPATHDKVFEQLNRINETPYFLSHLELNCDSNSFIPSKILNDLRRNAIDKLNQTRLKRRENPNNTYTIKPISFNIEDTPKLAVYCNTFEQYKAASDSDIEIIYYKDNVYRRNKVTYSENSNPILVGGYGGVHYFKNHSEMTTDFSLNVVNSKAINLLHNSGVNRITISHEINKDQINDMIDSYYRENNGYPNLEMIVYGRQDLMFTNYCPLKVNNLCGECKKNQYIIEDDYGHFPIISHNDCTTTILNGKILNLLDELQQIKNINVFRLQFTLEDYEESLNIINLTKNKLYSNDRTKCFNEETNTRGHFNKEIL